MSEPLLELREATTVFPIRKGGVFSRRGPRQLTAVDGVSLTLSAGEILGLVGESGCGKSTLARGIVQLAPLSKGSIFYEGRPLAALPARIRLSLQLIFQDPYASLNPRKSVYATLAEPMIAHRLVARRDAPAAVGALMERVGLAARFMRKYPHEFSGGQRQRIAIARALALKPRLILADEPVSALDVSVQAQILNLLNRLCAEDGLAMLLISHDLAVVRHMARRILVMYLGRIVESGPAAEVFERPRHPYTKALISAIPRPGAAPRRILLQGDPPSPMAPPGGCAFHPRCPWALPACSAIQPQLEACGEAHWSACLRTGELMGEKPMA